MLRFLAYLHRLAFAWLLLLLPPVAIGQGQCFEYSTRTNGSTSLYATSLDYQWAASTEEACEYSLQSVKAANPTIASQFTKVLESDPPTCHIRQNGNGFYSAGYATRPIDCAVVCVAGEQTWHNVTHGYDRTSNPTSALPALTPSGAPMTETAAMPPTSMCVNSCQRTRGTTIADLGDCFVSTKPTEQGLYRASCNWRFTSTATSCTEGPSEAPVINPTSAPPTCDGFVGYVNNEKRCVAKVPATGTQSPRTQTFIEGNPTAGTPGAPANIPATGDGGNAGGPAGAADGTRVYPDGTRATPTSSGPVSSTKTSVTGEEQLACGAPGQPRCKIDETGTPTGAGAYGASDTALAAADASRTAKLNDIVSAAGKDTSWAIPAWAQPQATCSAWDLGTLPVIDFKIELDMCALKPYITGVANFLWVFGTFLACLAMMGRVMGKGVV
jgi:hypothetical protein